MKLDPWVVSVCSVKEYGRAVLQHCCSTFNQIRFRSCGTQASGYLLAVCDDRPFHDTLSQALVLWQNHYRCWARLVPSRSLLGRPARFKTVDISHMSLYIRHQKRSKGPNRFLIHSVCNIQERKSLHRYSTMPDSAAFSFQP